MQTNLGKIINIWASEDEAVLQTCRVVYVAAFPDILVNLLTMSVSVLWGGGNTFGVLRHNYFSFFYFT